MRIAFAYLALAAAVSGYIVFAGAEMPSAGLGQATGAPLYLVSGPAKSPANSAATEAVAAQRAGEGRRAETVQVALTPGGGTMVSVVVYADADGKRRDVTNGQEIQPPAERVAQAAGN